MKHKIGTRISFIAIDNINGIKGTIKVGIIYKTMKGHYGVDTIRGENHCIKEEDVINTIQTV